LITELILLLGALVRLSVLCKGCASLPRKLSFVDKLAKIPYRISDIKGIISSLITHINMIKTSKHSSKSLEFGEAEKAFADLQKSTRGLCKGENSLPVLAVDLQKHCDLLQDAKVVTIFNMIAVPCFVYQGAVNILGEKVEHVANSLGA